MKSSAESSQQGGIRSRINSAEFMGPISPERTYAGTVKLKGGCAPLRFRMKAAFFDVTGTILQERTIPDYIKFVITDGLLKEKNVRHLETIHEEHKKHHLTELENSQRIVREIAKSLKGIPARKFKAENRKFLEAGVHFYGYSLPLLEALKGKGYALVAVSGAFEEMVAPFASSLGFKAGYGTVLEEKDGKYTGKVKLDLTKPEEKKRVAEKCAARMKINLKESFCFGDMVLDEGMMGLVGKPVALNAGPALLKACHRNNWPCLTHAEIPGFLRKL